jgi:hypothetical protein
MTALRILSADEPVHVDTWWRTEGPGSVVSLVLPSREVTLTPREARRVAAELEAAARTVEEVE